jgi:hypothetical protein
MAQIIGFDTMNTPQNTMVLTGASGGIFTPDLPYNISTPSSLANTWFYYHATKFTTDILNNTPVRTGPKH